MRVPTNAAPPSLDDGVAAIVHEVTARGDERMQECLHYVMREAAGSSTLLFANSPYPRVGTPAS